MNLDLLLRLGSPQQAAGAPEHPDNYFAAWPLYLLADAGDITVDGSNRVSAWANRGTGDIVMRQGTDDNKPVFTDPLVGVDFDGTNDFMVGRNGADDADTPAASVASATERTVILVATMDAANANGTNPIIAGRLASTVINWEVGPNTDLNAVDSGIPSGTDGIHGRHAVGASQYHSALPQAFGVAVLIRWSAQRQATNQYRQLSVNGGTPDEDTNSGDFNHDTAWTLCMGGRPSNPTLIPFNGKVLFAAMIGQAAPAGLDDAIARLVEFFSL
jgi:hypothetical protein